MIKLPQVTLIAVTGLYYDVEGHKKAIEQSCKNIEFGEVKVIMNNKVNDVDDHNKFIVYDLWKYIDTEYVFLCHADGYIINFELWNPKWLMYDYCGSPWPLPRWKGEFEDEIGRVQRVGNSVGLRTKKLLEVPTKYNFEWKSYYGNTNEDGFFCVHNRKRLEDLGMKFMPFEESLIFGKEYELPENKGMKTFCFHQST